MDVSAIASSLRLELLPELFVHEQWKEGYFTDEAELELDFESVDVPHILSSLSQDIFSGVETGALKGWPELVEQGLDFKRFLYVIHYLLCTAISKLEEEQHRTNGIFAARVYFSFLAVPQGGPFLIYQSNIYRKALRMLQCGDLLKNPEVQSPSRGRGRGRGSRPSCDDQQPPMSTHTALPRYEAEILKRLLISSEVDLIKALRMQGIGQEGDAQLLTIEALSNIAMQETTRPDLLSKGIVECSENNSRSLALNAFYGLSILCSEEHGDVTETVRLIMRFAFEALMLGFKKDSKALSSSYVNAVRDVFIDFVHHVCNTQEQRAHEGLFTLIQHLCMSTPDRADSRPKLVDSVVSLILKLPFSLIYKSCGHVAVMSCHEKAAIRLFSIEVMGRISTALKINCIDGKPEECGYKIHKILFAAILARVQDLSALVRSRSMSLLVSFLKESSLNECIRYLLSEIFVQPYLSCSNMEKVQKKEFKNFNEIASSLQRGLDVTDIPLPCALSIINELCEFCDDDKVMVRKSALQFLLRILHLNLKFLNSAILTEIGSHCRDESVLVRKMVLQEFTDLLLMYPSHQQLMRQWAMDIVPSIFDSEISVVEKVLECFERAILNNLVLSTEMMRPKHRLPLLLMSQITKLQLRKAFLKACSLWKEETLRSRKLIPILKSHVGIGQPYNDSAWVMLWCLAEFMTIKDPEFVLDFYHEEIYCVPNVNTYISQLVMEVLWLTWKQLPPTDKSSLAHELNTDLILFKVPVHLISRAVDIRYGLHITGKEGSDVDHPPDWASQLIKKCEESIFEILKLNPGEVQDEEAMKRFILTLANMCLYYPRIVSSRTAQQLILMLSPPEEEVPDFWIGTCGGELKAALVVALGKLGLQNENLAKRLIDVLGALLSVVKESDVKNNILISLTDLSIRYTSLGDELLPDMCVCLKDTLQPVRQNTLNLLVQLVQEDYIKIRNNVLFHLLSMLNDEDYTIVNMTRVFFVDTVLRKKSNCFTSAFITSILHYNRYELQRRSTEVPLTKREEEVFDISGPQNREKRHNIYRFMLSHSSDDDCFTISQHLCIEICKSVLDGKIKLTEKGEEVLRDCLYVMDCDEIHITDSKDADDDDDDTPADVEDASELVLHFAHKKILSEVVKKAVVERVIPTLSKLKKKLSSQGSPLTADVLRVLKNVIHTHKIDVEDIQDRQLVREIRRQNIRREGNSSGVSSEDSEDNYSSQDDG